MIRLQNFRDDSVTVQVRLEYFKLTAVIAFQAFLTFVTTLYVTTLNLESTKEQTKEDQKRCFAWKS